MFDDHYECLLNTDLDDGVGGDNDDDDIKLAVQADKVIFVVLISAATFTEVTLMLQTHHLL